MTDAGRVLVVDDEDSLRRAFVRLLTRKGHSVLEARRGSEALDILDQRDVDVVLSDITMPDMSGVELLREVRARKPNVPVILMTGAPHLETAMKAVEYGALEYLVKPIETARLEASVSRAIHEHRATLERLQVLDAARGDDRSPIAVGSVLAGRYRVTRVIGAGGMGTVFAAERVDDGSSVAIKVLHRSVGERPELLERFHREAEVIAKVHHPNIVRIVDFVLDDSGPTFLVMELLIGITLARAIADARTFSEHRCAFVASQMLDALDAAHAANIVHRDLKPENVFLTGEVVKLLDFGIAKIVSDDAASKLTETGTVLGTPAYMAPEYARGEKADALGDVYAVGCVMYEMLAGKPPFAASNYNALLFAIQCEEPDLRACRPDVSAEMCAIIAQAMSKERSARLRSAHAMRDALAPWLVTKR